jgi:glycosyltransferase involved in cell wall biosynthesis
MKRTLMFVVNVDWFFMSHRLPIALEAIKQGYDVHIVTSLTNQLAELERHGLVVHPLGLIRGSTGISNAWLAFVEIWKIFRAVRPDVVHLVTIKPILLGGMAARLVGVPSVVAAVSGLGYVFMAHGIKASIRRLLVNIFYRIAFGHPNLKVIFQNPEDLATLTKAAWLSEKQTVIIRGSGVDLSCYPFTLLPDDVPIVVLAARLLEDKGIFEFVAAARLLKQQGCQARFVLVGNVDPDNPTSCKQADVDSWVHEGIVEWWGYRTDMYKVLAASYLVVLPSYREGMPKVLLEAAACGRAVVTTDVPGCRDAIDVGVTGVLVPVRSVIELAKAMEDLIGAPLKCKTMGNAGRKLAERAFDVRQVVKKHMSIYLELIAKS